MTLWKAKSAVLRIRGDLGASHANQCAVIAKNGRKFESDHKSAVKLIFPTAACTDVGENVASKNQITYC